MTTSRPAALRRVLLDALRVALLVLAAHAITGVAITVSVLVATAVAALATGAAIEAHRRWDPRLQRETPAARDAATGPRRPARDEEVHHAA